MTSDENDRRYFRVNYRKLNTEVRFFHGLRCDLKFEVDADNKWVFSLYPLFEQVADISDDGEHLIAPDEGTAIISKPIYEDRNGYYDMIRARVRVGAKAYFVGGGLRFGELEITEILNEL